MVCLLHSPQSQLTTFRVSLNLILNPVLGHIKLGSIEKSIRQEKGDTKSTRLYCLSASALKIRMIYILAGLWKSNMSKNKYVTLEVKESGFVTESAILMTLLHHSLLPANLLLTVLQCALES